MRMNIYVQDDLAEQVKQHEDLNASAVCQAALRREVERRATTAALDSQMQRHEVSTDDMGDVAFVGQQVAYNDSHGVTTVYLTRRHRLALHHEGKHESRLYQYDTFAEFAQQHEGRPELVSEVADAIGEHYVTELDI